MKRIKQINHLALFFRTFLAHALAGYPDKVRGGGGWRQRGKGMKGKGKRARNKAKKGLPTPINELKIVLHSFNCE